MCIILDISVRKKIKVLFSAYKKNKSALGKNDLGVDWFSPFFCYTISLIERILKTKWWKWGEGKGNIYVDKYFS